MYSCSLLHTSTIVVSNSAKVYSARWWMASYGSKTPKRHVMYSNSQAIGAFDMGRLCFDYKNPEYLKHRTTKITITEMPDGTTKKAFQGVKGKLKNTQYLDFLGFSLVLATLGLFTDCISFTFLVLYVYTWFHPWFL